VYRRRIPGTFAVVERQERPILESAEGRIAARWPTERSGTGISVDFSSIRLAGGAESVRGMPLVRACGVERARAGELLVDATAGLGYDAFILALAGFRVIAVERSLDVFRLLEDGLRRTPHERLTIRCGDARAVLAELVSGGERLSVITLDPMYPPKRRASALPPKEMQIVRALVGDDADSALLFAAASASASRVVVKRPLHAESFGDPHHVIEGKLARFDVFEAGAIRGQEGNP
jgi:16S rRNA (guanine1516-N2)-methyltransferase